MTEILVGSPLVLLFVVSGIGFALGKVRIFGVRFGVAAVLFTGLAISSLDARLVLPDIISSFGLILFVYTTGLSSGPTFLMSLRRSGLRDNALVIGVLTSVALAARFIGPRFGLSANHIAGLFAGCLTNTPTLAAALERLTAASAPPTAHSESIVAYSVTYPIGVVGVIIALVLFRPRPSQSESRSNTPPANPGGQLVNRTVRIERLTQAPFSRPGGTLAVSELQSVFHCDVAIGRVKRGSEYRLASDDFSIQDQDLVTLVGTKDEVERVTQILGRPVSVDLSLDRSHHDSRRIFVSNPWLQGKRLSDLESLKRVGAVITRIRRGDVDFIPHKDTRLRLGERVRVVAPREAMGALTRYFGDSYKTISEVDIATFAFGIVFGILVGMIPCPLPGGTVIRFGSAGGPLIVGLILGSIGRTGSLCWDLPYSANLSLRQLGLVLFLAGVGTKSGFAFFSTFKNGNGLSILLLGSALTLCSASAFLLLGRFVFKIPFPTQMGLLAGFQTQPAALAFAKDTIDDEAVDIGYSTVFPVAILTKLFLLQTLL